MMNRFIVCTFGIVTAAILAAAIPSGAAGAGSPRCIEADTTNLTPTTRAPEWYQPGVTVPCDSRSTSPFSSASFLTAYWVYYEPCFGCSRWRTTPDNADYSANDCVASYTTCGDKIIGDAPWFYQSCTGQGLSAGEVANNIRYWADRARANGSNWRVYTFTETGGYPYGCAFSVTHV